MPLVKEFVRFRYASRRRSAMKRLAVLVMVVAIALALAAPVLAQ